MRGRDDLDGVIDANMNRVFEGTTQEVFDWLVLGPPDIADLYLISMAPNRAVLTVYEYLETKEKLSRDK